LLDDRPHPDLLPQEKGQQAHVSFFTGMYVRQIQPREHPERLRTILLLFGEKAGIREDKISALWSQPFAVGLVVTIPAN